MKFGSVLRRLPMFSLRIYPWLSRDSMLGFLHNCINISYAGVSLKSLTLTKSKISYGHRSRKNAGGVRGRGTQLIWLVDVLLVSSEDMC